MTPGGGTPIQAWQGGPVGLRVLPNGYQMAQSREITLPLGGILSNCYPLGVTANWLLS